MTFNSDKFGNKRDTLTDSVFNYFNFDAGIIPPPPEYVFLIDNDGDFIIDNDGDYLIEAP